MERRSALFKAGEGLLAASLVAVLVSFFLTWWTIYWFVPPIVSSPPSTIDGFSGWGWLNVASWIVLVISLVRFSTAQIRRGFVTHLEAKVLAVMTVVGGTIQLSGSLLLLAGAPTTHDTVPGQYVNLGVGPDVAIACGVTIIASGILMLAVGQHRKLAQLLLANSDERALLPKRGGADA